MKDDKKHWSDAVGHICNLLFWVALFAFIILAVRECNEYENTYQQNQQEKVSVYIK